MTPLLEFERVVSGYGAARVLHGIDLAIGAGERVAVLGRNGVGKTTVVNTLLGIAQRIEGAIRFAGRRIDDIRHFTAARAGVAVVLQGRAILPNLTVRENLILGAASGGRGEWTVERVYTLFPI